MAASLLPSQAELRNLIDYNATTGRLTWRVRGALHIPKFCKIWTWPSDSTEIMPVRNVSNRLGILTVTGMDRFFAETFMHTA